MSISGHVENGTPWNQREEREREKDTYYVLLSPSHSLSFFLVLFCILIWWSFHWLLSVGVQQLCFTLFSLEWAPRYNSTAVMYSSLFCVCRYLYILLTGARRTGVRKGMGPTLRLLNSFDIHSILYQFFSFLFFSFLCFPRCRTRSRAACHPSSFSFPSPDVTTDSNANTRKTESIRVTHEAPSVYLFLFSFFLSFSFCGVLLEIFYDDESCYIREKCLAAVIRSNSCS